MTLGTNKLIGTLVGASIAAGGAAAQDRPAVATQRVPPKQAQVTGGAVQIMPTDVFTIPARPVAVPVPAQPPPRGDVDEEPAPDMSTAVARARFVESQRGNPDVAMIGEVVDAILAARTARNSAPPGASVSRTDAVDAQSDASVLESAVGLALRHLDKPLLVPLLEKLKAQPDYFTPAGPLALSRAFETLATVANEASTRQWELLPDTVTALLDAGARPRRDQVLRLIAKCPSAPALARLLQALVDSAVDLRSSPAEIVAAIQARPFVTHPFVLAQQARGTPALQPTAPRAPVRAESEAEQIAQLVNAAVRDDLVTWSERLAAISPSQQFPVGWPAMAGTTMPHAAQRSTSAPRREPTPRMITPAFDAAMQAAPRLLHELIVAAERHAKTAQPGRASPPETWRVEMRNEADVARQLAHVSSGAPENASRIALLLAAGVTLDRDVAKTLLAQSQTPAAFREMAEVLSAQGIDFYRGVATDWILGELPFAVADVKARLAAGGPIAQGTPPAFAVRGTASADSIQQRRLVVAIRRGDARAFDAALGNTPFLRAWQSTEVADAAVHAADTGALTKLATAARLRGESMRRLWNALAVSTQSRDEMVVALAAVAPADARTAAPMVLAAKNAVQMRTVLDAIDAQEISLGTTEILNALIDKPFDTRSAVARAADALTRPFGGHDEPFGASLRDALNQLTQESDGDRSQPFTNVLPLLEPERFARIGGTARDAYQVARTLMFAGAQGKLTADAALPLMQAALANGCLNADQTETVFLPGRNPARARLMLAMALRFPALVEKLATSTGVATTWDDVAETVDGHAVYNVVHALKYDGSPQALSLARVLEGRGVVALPKFTDRAASPVGMKTSAVGVKLRR